MAPTRLVLGAAIGLVLLALGPAHALTPKTVDFESEDGKTRLTAYLYKPDGAGPHPAVVALHGRTGLYSSRSETYDAAHLSPHKKMWGDFWATRGYLVLFIDTFGSRGHPAGFAAGTIKQRPPEINEITVRPLDAYAGLKYLRTRADVVKSRVYVQGWSNGGAAALSTMAVGAPGRRDGVEGFRAAVAIYPACTQVSDYYGRQYRTYAPLILFIGTDDREVKPANCRALASAAKANGSNFDIVLYEGAEHSYDTPIPSRQHVAANVAASEGHQAPRRGLLPAASGLDGMRARPLVAVSLVAILLVALLALSARICADGGAMASTYRTCSCQGVEWTVYDRTAADGPRRTLCFGVVRSTACYASRGGPKVPCQ